MVDKPRRIQIRISFILYQKLLREAIMNDLPFSQVCRVHLSGKRLINERGEENG